jgi:hypothetical protein
MALIPLNTFKTKTFVLTTQTNATVYTAPVGVTSIVLMANVANVTTGTYANVTFAHHRNLPVLADAQGNGGQPGNVTTELVKNYEIPPNDAGNMLVGKMIIESLDSVRAYSTKEGTLKLTMSILETANA